MPYLHRRIERLIDMVNTGKLLFDKDVDYQYVSQLKADMAAISRLQSGEIDLTSCSPMVRSFARMMYGAESIMGEQSVPRAEPSHYTVDHVLNYQREYFNLLDEVFRRIFGMSAQEFATPDTFVAEMKKGHIIGDRSLITNYEQGLVQLHEFHGNHMLDAFSMSKDLHGMKLVLGGGSRFTSSHLDALRQTLLYADTFLIPDPVLPWLEDERAEERFHLIQPLVQIHCLLHLKPLIDAPLPYPAVVVFPSFDRLLAKHDRFTMDAIGGLLLDFFSHYLERPFEDESEIAKYAIENEADFLSRVENRHLFIAPNQKAGAPLRDMVKSYRAEIQTWRSNEHAKVIQEMTDGLLVFQGICERLEPQYHLNENVGELGAQPMMCIEQQWHYFRLCSDILNDSLAENNVVSPKSFAALRALGQEQFRWLTDIPIEVLAELRADRANEEFRRRIAEYVSHLGDAKVEDLDNVAWEVASGIDSLLREHDRAVDALDEEYRRKYKLKALAGFIGAAACLYPALAPFVKAVAPIGIAGALGLGASYLGQKMTQYRDTHKLSRSLTGVLATAKKRGIH